LESEWGLNVPLQGFGSAGATLAARLLVAATTYLTNAKADADTAIGFIRPLLDTDDVPYTIFGFPIDGDGNFPYGRDVAPNVPV